MTVGLFITKWTVNCDELNTVSISRDSDKYVPQKRKIRKKLFLSLFLDT